ncbi:MAG: DUF58 domain-containing protein [Actinobacteria bacterium]|nr:MAG: DUF58 domain-containing protein [Actinomycetota bacterium]
MVAAWKESVKRWLRALHTRVSALPLIGRVIRFFSSITQLGWAVTLSGVLGTIIGIYSSWAEVTALGISALALLVGSVLLSMGRTGHGIDLHLERNRVIAGDKAIGELVITNPTGHSLSSTWVELVVGTSTATFSAPRLAHGEEHQESFIISTARRGIVPVGPAITVRGDPLGLMRRSQVRSESLDLYVHPAMINIAASTVGFVRDIEGATTQDLSSADVSFHALRDYVPGDDRRNVHWRSTAHTGKVMVRQFEETRRSHLLLVLDLDRDAWASEEEFECAVSVAASLVRAAGREAKETSIVTQVGPLNASSPVLALDALSAVEEVIAAERLPELAYKAACEVPQASVAFLITGSRASLTALHSSMVRMPLSMIVATLLKKVSV